MKVPFVKYQGAGNDFVLIDCCRPGVLLSSDLGALARFLCDRHYGIGGDGLLLVLDSTVADYRMRIFNADGSEPAMCGNGIRCLVDYVFKCRGALSALAIETMDSILQCRHGGDQIAVQLGVPAIVHWPAKLAEGSAFVVDTGVPHAVLFVDDLDALDVAIQGRKIRFHALFSPHGVNVNFVRPDGKGGLCLRTYERGVEGETLACGTGAAAAAFVAATLQSTPSLVHVAMRSPFSGDLSTVYTRNLSFLCSDNGGGGRSVEMFGRAEKVFEGWIDL